MEVIITFSRATQIGGGGGRQHNYGFIEHTRHNIFLSKGYKDLIENSVLFNFTVGLVIPLQFPCMYYS